MKKSEGRDTLATEATPIDRIGQGVHLTERTIPVPKSISPEAQAALASGRPRRPPGPPISDKAAWRTYIAETNAGFAAMIKAATAAMPARSSLTDIAGVPVYVGEPGAMPEGNRDKALIFLHGGALVLLGGEPVKYFAMVEAVNMRCKVFAVDYRNPPDGPYPAALDDCVAVYRELLKTYPAEKITISGVSGGGNLAAAMTLKIRDLGMPLPSAVGLFSPEVDLTESGDSFQTNRDIDVVLRGSLADTNALYAGGHDLADPYVSPLFGDFSKGFPPTFVQSGTRDLFLSNSVRIHRKLRNAGIDAELHVWEALPHAVFGGAPEDREPPVEFTRFLARVAAWAIR
jgi:epsilon-lactone hydrolase